MAERTKVLVTGATQSIRLPRSCRFPEGHKEVYVRRVGKKVVLEPTDEWSPEFVASLGAWTKDIESPAADARERAS
jgi:virulence-associated protein VagC